MIARPFSNIAGTPSLLGFGCMRLPLVEQGKTDIDYPLGQQMIDYAYEHGVTYFDTAYPYHEGKSEIFIGHALRKYPRQSFYLADKMPGWLVKSEADADRIFEEQLRKCQVDYFDFYLCHALSEQKYEADYAHTDIYGVLQRKKAEGKIRNLGFSFHDTPAALEKILAKHSWDFVQIQLNYLDWEMQDAQGQYALIEAYGVPCIVMEPVRGGVLASLSPSAAAVLKQADPDKSVASWAIRYAASLPNVMTVLSGMTTLEQVQDNVATMTPFVPLNEREYGIVENALSEYRRSVTIPCTGCRYCMDCPAGVDIPQMFALYNQFAIDKKAHHFRDGYMAMQESKRADRCVACGQCMQHCPQGICIPDEMQKIQQCLRPLLADR